MPKLLLLLTVLLFCCNTGDAQTPKLRCVETSEKGDSDEKYETLIKTCYFKNLKFVTTQNPDGVGRYFDENAEHTVYVKVQGRYTETTNSTIFNKRQNELLSIINKKIHSDYRKYSTSPKSKDCFTGTDPIPKWYAMDDLEISIEGNKISFSVLFGLPQICRWVDGSIVEFKFADIINYLK